MQSYIHKDIIPCGQKCIVGWKVNGRSCFLDALSEKKTVISIAEGAMSLLLELFELRVAAQLQLAQ
jgi:hypothetical protein